jgi:hypothetical protein
MVGVQMQRRGYLSWKRVKAQITPYVDFGANDLYYINCLEMMVGW